MAEDCILGRVQGDMGDVDFEVLVRVGFASIAVQGERFPLGRALAWALAWAVSGPGP